MEEIKLFSFDVFDTLITRKTATPQGIFVLMQYEMKKSLKYKTFEETFVRDFPLIRIHAEKLARNRIQRNGIEDINLTEIYQYVSMRGELTKSQIVSLIQLEIETELENVVPIENNIKLIKEYLSQDKRVILISDMYLTAEVIRKMLLKADDIFETIPLYVSCEYRKIKYSGNLYREVQKYECVESKQWLHKGDNSRGDIDGAKKVGIRTEKYIYPQFNEYENFLLEKNRYDKNVQLIVGASKNARLNFPEQNVAAYSVGTTIGGPMLLAYSEWIVYEACKKGITRLYFIARDGYILKKIVDYIIKLKNINMETKYIYGSRRAWRMVSVKYDRFDLNDFLSWSHVNRINSIEKLADLFQIDKMDIASRIPYSLKGDERISPIIRNQIIESLDNEEFRRFLINTHEEKRKLAINYMKENIDVNDDNFAFVELSGSGYTQECLANLISDFYCKPILTFFFKMDMLRENDNCRFMTYFPCRLNQNILIEALCHAPHGQTVGYEDNGKVQPIIENYEEQALLEHGINEYIEGILAFVEEKYKADCCEINLENVYDIYDFLNKTENKIILDFIGDMPNSVTGREKELVGYAPKLTNRDIYKIFLGNRRNSTEYYAGTSLECSVKRCNKAQKNMIAWCNKIYNKLPGKIYRKVFETKGSLGDTVIPNGLKKKELVLYGAGERGKDFYRQLKKQQVVLWVDKNWETKRQEGLPVCAVEKIKETEFDMVIITIEDRKVSQSVKKLLVDMGIGFEKIICL